MILEIAEGVQSQTPDEELIYSITTTNWGSDPESVAVKVYQEPSLTDVTSTAMSTNDPSVDSDVITLSPLKSLTRNSTYRVDVKFTSGSNVFECYFRVKCE